MRINDILIESFSDAKRIFSQEEDDSTVTNYLNTFRDLVKRNIIQGQEKDISFWIKQGWESFKEFVDKKKDQPSNRDIKRKKVNKSKDSITLYEDENLIAILPLSEEASCYYGKETNWCISVVSVRNKFGAYLATLDVPINIFKKDTKEQYAIVYDLHVDEVYEVRDSNNALVSMHEVIDDSNVFEKIITNVKKHRGRIEKASEYYRLQNPYNAVSYAEQINGPYPEGEKLITKDPFTLAKYLLVTTPKDIHSNLIDEAVLNFMLKGLTTDSTPYIDEEKTIEQMKKIFNRYIKEFSSEILPKADVDELLESDLEFTMVANFIIKNDIDLTIEQFKKFAIEDSNKFDEEELIVDLEGYGPIEYSLDYVENQYKKGNDIKPYIEILTEMHSDKIEFYIRQFLINLDPREELFGRLLNYIKITGPFISKVLQNSKNGEYIFEHIPFTAFTNPEDMYQILKIQPRVLDVIGELPDKLKKYIEDNDLKLPK